MPKTLLTPSAQKAVEDAVQHFGTLLVRGAVTLATADDATVVDKQHIYQSKAALMLKRSRGRIVFTEIASGVGAMGVGVALTQFLAGRPSVAFLVLVFFGPLYVCGLMMRVR